jgi:hypothetical protein
MRADANHKVHENAKEREKCSRQGAKEQRRMREATPHRARLSVQSAKVAGA